MVLTIITTNQTAIIRPIKTRLPGNFFYRQGNSRPVPPCFPATWNRWREALIAFEYQTPFSKQSGISENCQKVPLGLCIHLLLWMMFHPPNGGQVAVFGGFAVY
jgi:hypothetical protein